MVEQHDGIANVLNDRWHLRELLLVPFESAAILVWMTSKRAQSFANADDGAFAESERNIIRKRKSEDDAQAEARGVYKDFKQRVSEIAAAIGVSRMTACHTLSRLRKYEFSRVAFQVDATYTRDQPQERPQNTGVRRNDE